jgi:hypothetical protein
VTLVRLAVGVWTWFRSHAGYALTAGEIASLAGALIGTALLTALLVTAIRSAQLSEAVILTLSWGVVFSSYWFGTHPIRSSSDDVAASTQDGGFVFTLPDSAPGLDEIIAWFLLWLALFSLGPFLRAWHHGTQLQ